MKEKTRIKSLPPAWVLISLVVGTALLAVGHFWFSEPLIAAVGASVVILGITYFVLTVRNSPSKKRIFIISIFGGLFIASTFGVLSQTLLETAGTSEAVRKSVAAPAVEELLKPIGIWIALWAWWGKTRPKRKELAWIFLCGVLAGFIFGFVESLEKATDPNNLQNFGGSWEILGIRFQGAIWIHVFSTALVTTALCYKFTHSPNRKFAVPFMLFSAAIVGHSAWNSHVAGYSFIAFLVLAWMAVAVGLLLWLVTDLLLRRFLTIKKRIYSS